MKTLRPYQQEAVNREGDSIYLAMDMRLGKTLTAIRWLARREPERKRVLVLAPATTLISWEEELAEEHEPRVSLVGMPNKKRAEVLSTLPRGELFVLMNYEAVRCLERDIMNAKFDAIVCDEATEFKNPTAKLTKALIRLSDHIRYKVCLSGEPAPESWQNIFSQLAFLNDGFCMGLSSFYKWRAKYFYKIPGTFDWWLSAKSAAVIKSYWNDHAFILTRKQAGLEGKRVYEKRSLPLEKEAQVIHDHILETWQIPGEEEESASDSTKYAMVITSWLRRLCGGFVGDDRVDCWKYAELLKIVTKELPKDKIVVWFAFNREMRRCQEMLEDHGVSCGFMNGLTKTKDRHDIKNRFQDGDMRVLLIQERIGRYGIRLDAGDTAVYFSNSYSWLDRTQSEARIDLPGKKSPNLYIDFVTKNTLEEDILDALKDKKTDSRFLLARVQYRRSLVLNRSRPDRNRSSSMERE